MFRSKRRWPSRPSLRQFAKSKYATLFERIETSKELPADDEKALSAAIEDFKKTGTF